MGSILIPKGCHKHSSNLVTHTIELCVVIWSGVCLVFFGLNMVAFLAHENNHKISLNLLPQTIESNVWNLGHLRVSLSLVRPICDLRVASSLSKINGCNNDASYA